MIPALVVASAVALWWVVRRRRAERRDHCRDLAGATLALARTVRSGATVTRALSEVLGTAPDAPHGPVAGGIGRVVAATQRGRSLSSALEQWATGAPERHRCDIELVVAAIELAHASGGQLAAALEGVAVTLLDRAETAEEAAALSSQATASTVVLCVLPVLGVVMFATIDPRVGAVLLTTPLGWTLCAVALGLDLAAWAVSRVLTARTLR